MQGEITDHVGYEKQDLAGMNNANSRNGARAKTVRTDVGPLEVKVPRNVGGAFEPQIVKKRQRRRTRAPRRRAAGWMPRQEPHDRVPRQARPVALD